MKISFKRVLIIIGILFWSYFAINAYKIYSFSSEYSEEQSDVIIVLGTAIENGKPSSVFKERINHGIYLYNKGVAKKLLFTGGFGKGQNQTESSVAKEYAISKGIPDSVIIIEEKSKSTYENFKEAKLIMDSLSLKSALIVSDPFHMKRAMAFAEYYHIDCKPSPTKTTAFQFFIPKAMSLFYETVFYRIL